MSDGKEAALAGVAETAGGELIDITLSTNVIIDGKTHPAGSTIHVTGAGYNALREAGAIPHAGDRQRGAAE
ncbi:hypothetical protein EDE12_11813 [Methylosinus sp. sav-2]|uniref:hypothetical protein n=1 Tax=Methylosinus sp. sav-2 TaxID=2485168 RepID=UPI000B0E7194|nr:hypothetical protein [Methylosinus sp. sav-2]TDX60777.1 hypothetical protein EDE12_11813 [Methylosinus sp. sav-2]